MLQLLEKAKRGGRGAWGLSPGVIARGRNLALKCCHETIEGEKSPSLDLLSILRTFGGGSALQPQSSLKLSPSLFV